MRRGRPAEPTGDLAGLAQLGRVLGTATTLKAAFTRVVEHLEDLVGATSVGVWLTQGDQGELRIAAATGMAWQAQQRARYRMGEGITGRVVQTGKPVVVPRVTREPLFLNRTGIFRKAGAREASFISVPIPVGGRPAGALGVMLPFRPDARLDHEAELLVVAGSMLGQAVRVEQLVQSERQRYQQETRSSARN